MLILQIVQELFDHPTPLEFYISRFSATNIRKLFGTTKFSEENFYYLHDPQYLTDNDFEFKYNSEIKIQPFAIYCNVSNEDGENGHRITKEDIENKLDREIPEGTKYIEAEVSFQWLRFETIKSNYDEPPLNTYANGYAEKIK